MNNTRTSRKVTTRLLDMMDEGIIDPRSLVEMALNCGMPFAGMFALLKIDPRSLVEMALNWMSESDVAEMASRNDLFETEEEE